MTQVMLWVAVVAVVAGVAGVAGCGGHGSKSQTTSRSTETSTSNTSATPAFRASGPPVVVASGIPYAANLAIDARGGLWVASDAGGPNPADGVWYVPPGGRPRHVAAGMDATVGLAWVGERLYVSHISGPTTGAVTVFDGFSGRRFKTSRAVLDNLRIGRNAVGSLALGPNGRLFVGLGAPEDHSGPPGRVLSFAPSGGSPLLEATGLRNPFGLAFDGGRLLVTDSGRDDLGPFRPRDELNAFEPAGPTANFGFPGCYGQGGAACAGTRPPIAAFPAHSSPDGVAVKGHVAFVAESGSSFVQNPTGSDIVRIDLRTGRQDVFWRSPVKHDPIGVAIGPDGNLYVTLYASSKIVRFKL